MITSAAHQETKKPGEGATSSGLGSINPSSKEAEMNDCTHSSIHASMPNFTIAELITVVTATRRMMDSLEAIASMPRCAGSDAVSAFLDADYNRLGERLDAAARELAQRQPVTGDEIEDRIFAITSLAAAHRMPLPEFLYHFQTSGQ
ncbi:hypothetical protein ATCR1_06696 [Agrobacterium tumefaciens CCNWGS0286]|uniref:hypothetical protein n=1 Tax=Agrobacterium tumefaciens TaxID=358 RepID=UPI0002334896|nr:hypothetical protein [Agrobacterium tumefaciens]EHH07534.1 hypothetical protein ATCR1_06696 [Agrobacterium tumefaciens CCNWGS0286]